MRPCCKAHVANDEEQREPQSWAFLDLFPFLDIFPPLDLRRGPHAVYSQSYLQFPSSIPCYHVLVSAGHACHTLCSRRAVFRPDTLMSISRDLRWFLACKHVNTPSQIHRAATVHQQVLQKHPYICGCSCCTRCSQTATDSTLVWGRLI